MGRPAGGPGWTSEGTPGKRVEVASKVSGSFEMPRAAKQETGSRGRAGRLVEATDGHVGRQAGAWSEESSPIAAVERALQVLSAFRVSPRMTLEGLAQATGMYKSTLLRILGTLAGQGYVFRTQGGEYHIGGTVFELGSRYAESLSIEELLRPTLQELARSTGESAAFYVRHGASERQCMLRVDSPQMVRAVLLPGQIMKLGKEATSLVLTAHRTPGKRPAAASEFLSLTEFTSGVGESTTASVGAPVFDSRGLLGALIVSGPVHRFDAATASTFRARIAEAAADVSFKLGGIASPAGRAAGKASARMS